MDISAARKITIKVDSGPTEEDVVDVLLTKIDIDHKDIKEKSLEHSDRIFQTDTDGMKTVLLNQSYNFLLLLLYPVIL